MGEGKNPTMVMRFDGILEPACPNFLASDDQRQLNSRSLQVPKFRFQSAPLWRSRRISQHRFVRRLGYLHAHLPCRAFTQSWKARRNLSKTVSG